MERIKVAVSPFYGGENWTDELTRITFEKNERGLSVYSIPANLDLTNIRKAIRLNALILVEGNVGEHNEVVETIVEEPAKETPKEEAPVEEEAAPVAEEPKEEAPAEEEAELSIKEEAPKKPARKRAAKKTDK